MGASGSALRSPECEQAREALPEDTVTSLDALWADVPTRSLDSAAFQVRHACRLTLHSLSDSQQALTPTLVLSHRLAWAPPRR